MSQSIVPREPVSIECCASPTFQQWLAQDGGALAVSTYQAGKVAMIGWDGRQVTLLMREFEKPLGLAVAGNQMILATRHTLWIFANAPLLARDYIESQPGRYDALFLPRATYHTGDLNTHDVAFCADGIVLVASRFSCLARLSYDYSFEPFWRPRFVSDLVPEDRCHLNGLAVRDGRPRYVTALGTTDTPGGWRADKATGGVLIDVDANEVVLGGLSMPHSPRWYDDRLWVLNSGTGELLLVDPASGQATAVCGLPGYLRGLCFVGPYALVGLSKIREKHIFGGLPIQQRQARLLCGVSVIDTRSGQQVGWFEYTSGCEEVYDVQFLPQVRHPMILNLERPAVFEAMTNPDSCFWLRASSEIKTEPAAGGPAGPGPASLSSSSVQAIGPDETVGSLFPESGNPFQG